jgi:uncharacterized lipoprotein YbaY
MLPKMARTGGTGNWPSGGTWECDVMTTISINLVPPPDPPREPATVRISIEEVSQMDAPAHVVATKTFADMRVDRPQELDIDPGDLESGGRYVVRVHVDLDGSGVKAAGDLITTRAYPVDASRPMAVELHEI